MRPLTLLLLMVLSWLYYSLWWGKNGLKEYWKMRQAVLAIHADNGQLALRNQQLLADINALVDDLDAIEACARQQLGMVKPGERFYRLLPATPSQRKR